ncbi:DUF885 domain-containing protein [Sphingomonas morindae]|uniref:DUF885 family protein n=1 Tax=Sphingomonas morindae TaxID=1541170 RepID=A0ABY4XDE9_9SPHN|nr:DUF885 family protein [Sphingomonas morindae]USI74721.1 DUF885 family protein [Sphingomonas morindae]
MSTQPSPARRQILQALAATAAGAALPRAAGAASTATAEPLHPLLDRFADELLVLQPDQATQLGVDTGARAALRGTVADVSAETIARFAAQARSMKQRLGAIRRAGLAPADQLRYDTVAYATDRASEGTAFAYGRGAWDGFAGGAQPYVITQQNATVLSVPEFLNSVQPVKTAADAEAHLARVAGMARQIDEETARLTHDAGLGVVPPAFIAANALGQLRAFRATPAAAQPLVASLAARAAKAGIAGDWAGRAAGALDRLVYPALDRQIAAFTRATAQAGTQPGVARLPDGEAYYRWALRLGTTTTQSPDEVHRIGLAQNEELLARIDTLLKAQGLTKGSVGERVAALNKDPRFLYPNTDAGRADLIAYLNGCIDRVRPLMPRLSHLKLKADVMVKRVPVDIQDGAALGYMNFASLDGSRPAIYYVNLKTTALWPKYQLQTLTAHEGIPGHTWQGAYLAEHHDEIPLITSLLGFNAFVEGWALYAEQLVDEQGIYADDPFGQIGYLQAQQFRACRLVTDTGLHAKGWSRDQAIAFLTAQTGKGVEAMTSEVDRYCVAPGQACGYKTGHNEIVRQRARAKAALGARFDLAAFDDAVVETGGVPLELLGPVIDRHIARARG